MLRSGLELVHQYFKKFPIFKKMKVIYFLKNQPNRTKIFKKCKIACFLHMVRPLTTALFFFHKNPIFDKDHNFLETNALLKKILFAIKNL